MDMIHKSHVHWTPSGQATYTITATHPSSIPHDDPIYLAGGWVYRVVVTTVDGETENRHVQLCDIDSCHVCSGDATKSALIHTGEMEGEAVKPVIHCKDVQKEGEGWRFEPKKARKYEKNFPDNTFDRLVRFADAVERVVQVCEVRTCKVCGAKRPEWGERQKEGGRAGGTEG